MTDLTNTELADRLRSALRDAPSWDSVPVSAALLAEAARRLRGEPVAAETSAQRTLTALGYMDHGGEQWKPPLGKRPLWLDRTSIGQDLLDAVSKLIKAKGRFHTEQNYKAVVAAYGAVIAAVQAESP